MTVSRANAVHSQHLVFYSHVLKPTSLFHLEEMFLLSLVCTLFSRGMAKDGKNDPLPNNLTTPTATQQDSFFSVYKLTVSTKRSSILMLSTKRLRSVYEVYKLIVLSTKQTAIDS